MSVPDKIIHASAIALMDGDKVLLCTRPIGKDLAGMLEFPGGKVEQGEMPKDALVREINEELDIVISSENLVPVTFTEYHYKDLFRVVLYLYVCFSYKGELQAKENQSFAWYDVNKLDSLENIVPADVVFIKPLQTLVNQTIK